MPTRKIIEFIVMGSLATVFGNFTYSLKQLCRAVKEQTIKVTEIHGMIDLIREKNSMAESILKDHEYRLRKVERTD